MKKQYQKPEQRVVVLQNRCQILAGSELRNISGDTGIGYGGGGSGPSRARGFGGWNEE